MNRPILALAAVLALASTTRPEDDLMTGPPKGPWRRLFLDAMVIEQQTGLARVFHAAEKHPGNPLLKYDRPWEGSRCYGPTVHGGTVMWDEGKLRMWYLCRCSEPGGRGYRTCYAESTDGLTWTKPELGLIEFDGSTKNNICVDQIPDPTGKWPKDKPSSIIMPSVIKRPWERDPAKRYALFCISIWSPRCTRSAFSPDGLRWTFVPEPEGKGIFPSGDVTNFCWDPYRSKYVATWKTSSRRGRAAGVTLSPDGVTWSRPVEGPVFAADDLDPDATQIYGMPIFPYQGLTIGLPWIYHARWFKYAGYTDQRMFECEMDSPRTMDVQLSWSWDLINWTRTLDRKPFIALGKEGEWDDGMVISARGPVLVDGQLYFYYGGFDCTHDETGKGRAATGLAVLRLDGFCSMHAGEEEGWLITRREPFGVPKVTINAKTAKDGYVVAELLDRDNHPIPGFGRDDCARFVGDSTEHMIEWKTTAFPEELADKDKKIRFVLRNADLYSYLPESLAK